MSLISDTKAVLDTVRQQADRILLFYSCGKDSIAMLDLCAQTFTEVICVFMYFVPSLEHQQRFIRYSEKRYPNVRFIQVPHWSLSFVLKNGLFCQPRDIKTITLKDINESLRLQTNTQFSFFGMKKSDSLNRCLMLKGYDQQAICTKSGNVYPLSAWKQIEVLRYIKLNRLPKPVRYTIQKSNGLTFNADVFTGLLENYPEDLLKIYETFPQSRKILIDYDRDHQISEQPAG